MFHRPTMQEIEIAQSVKWLLRDDRVRLDFLQKILLFLTTLMRALGPTQAIQYSVSRSVVPVLLGVPKHIANGTVGT
jgi:hypothetical protein